MQVRNPKYNSSGTIDMEIDHLTYGWVPFTASPNDAESTGRDLYAQTIAGDFGAVSAYVVPPPAAPTQSEFTAAIQVHLDTVAKIKNYDSMLSCCSYANSTNITFKAEADMAIAWRDAVWAYGYTQLAAVQAGTRAVPVSTAAFIAELPAAPW